jgi:hypothetical protein
VEAGTTIAPKTETKSAETALSPFDPQFVSISSEDCLHLIGPKMETTDEPVSILEPDCLHLNRDPNGDKISPKWRQNGDEMETKSVSSKAWPTLESALPTSNQMRAIVVLLAADQDASGLGYTRRTKREDICKKLQIPSKSLAKQITRLCEAQYLRRMDARRGRGRGAGTVYQIHPQALSAALALSRQNLAPQTANGDKSSGKWRQVSAKMETTNGDKLPNAPRSSSSIPIASTTTGKPDSAINRQQHRDLDAAIARFTGGELFNANDVVQLWQRKNQPFESLETLLESLEHVLFYIETERQQGRALGKGWAVQTLMRGYYGPPANFVSWQEKQLAAETQAAQQRSSKIKQAKQKHFDAMFDAWFEELTDERISQLKKGTSYAHASGQALKQRLRAKFVEESGFEDPSL